ncbi:hypothetical protein BDV96DRAFT_650632 [Lophiotrema nucula]|uniref:AAA+ ATPase domain-containing protein n=1 Tax=Lophiotrema nucula TaxID=690887 RepID=A0A6A5YVE8_9PLEO|nr:hypothetical protein BDV96DRAFT_650632 [Lophiotrema nucula]
MNYIKLGRTSDNAREHSTSANHQKRFEAIPDWFLEHRVQTVDQLAVQALPLQIIRNGKPTQLFRNAHGMAEASEDTLNLNAGISGRKRIFSQGLRFRGRRRPTSSIPLDDQIPLVDVDGEPAHDWQRQESNETDGAAYRVDDSIYAPVQALLHQDASDHQTSGQHGSRVRFKRDAVLIRLPDGYHSNRGMDFCSIITKCFAQQAGANLLTLDVEDVSDLQQHVLRSKDKVNNWQNGDYDNYALELLSSSFDDFPFKQMLSAPGRPSRGATKKSGVTPLVIHIQEVCDLIEVHGIDFLRKLRKSIGSKRRPGSTIIFLTTSRFSRTKIRSFAPAQCQCGSCKGFFPPQEVTDLGKAILHSNRKGSPFADYNAYNKTDLLNAAGTNPEMHSIYVEPTKNTVQSTLLESHWKAKPSSKDYNIRGLQRWLRQRSVEYHALDLLQPFVTWPFLEGTEVEKDWATHPLNHCELAKQIPDTPSDEDLKDSILNVKSSHTSDKQHRFAAEGEDTSLDQSGNRPSVRKLIADIQYDGTKWEKALLDCIVEPQDSREGWDEIVIDDEVKETMLRILGLQSHGDIPSYGLMKQRGARGALLYGPPGTGKTHLARVLARESNATMLSVSAGELWNKYFGESEQAIKTLFSLARKLEPCILFIDEADAMFRRRRSSGDDHNTVRSVTNQLLHEIDGLKRSSQSPFMLLATNLPADLDYAIYRRVPTRVYIGLPSAQLRFDMLRIFLRDEMLDTTVDLQSLARRFQGYSGSDIQTICVQAALACDTCVGPRDRRRLLKLAHFEIAMHGSAPTVTSSTMEKIKTFAAEYDPSALHKITREKDSTSVAVNAVPNEESTTRHAFHLPDVEHERPNLQHLDLESLWPDPEISIPNQEQPAKTSEEIAVVDGDEVCATDEMLHYKQLKPNSKEVRVLYVLPKSQSKGESTEEMLHVTMKTVSLDDWTDTYRNFQSWAKSQNLPSTPKYRHALWALVGAYSYAASQVQQNLARGIEKADIIDWTESRLSCNNDWRFNPYEPISHRFKWGDYVALSYVWGDTKDPKTITVNGHLFSVTANLYDALVDLRDSAEISNRKLHVWIDAICINQNDLAERASEVQKMSLIYSECLAVRAWLGKPKESTTATQILKIRRFLDATVQVNPRRCTWEMVQSFIEVDTLVQGANLLFTLPHWKRLWIIQEKALAPSLHFKFGREQFMTLDFIRLAGWCFGHPLPRKLAPDISQIAMRLQRLRKWEIDAEIANNRSFSIFDIVRFAQTSKASDARDKLYGMLALLPAQIAKSIRPDYTSSNGLIQILTHFSRKCYEFEGSLDTLARVRILDKRPGLPTWALDLDSDAPEDEPRGLLLENTLRRNYRANDHMSKDGFTFSDNGRLLRCHGVIVDVVDSLAQPLQPYIHGLTPFTSSISQLSDETQQSSTYPNADLALCRVLMSDEDFQLNPNNPSILDIPWLDPSDCPAPIDAENSDAPLRDIPDLCFSTAPLPWSELYRTTGFATLFHFCLYHNADYLIGGRPLRSYFASPTGNDVCQNPVAYRSILFEVAAGMASTRLCTTKRGRVGMAPKLARPGDKAKEQFGLDPIPVEKTFWKDDAPRNLLSGRDEEILSKLQASWDEHQQIWDDSGIGNQFSAVADQITERLESAGIIGPVTVVFIGLGSLHDKDCWPDSFIGHMTAERILAVLRAKILASSGVLAMFEDPHYTLIDNEFLIRTFGRQVAITPNNAETFTQVTTRVMTSNSYLGLTPILEGESHQEIKWERVLYVTGRSHQPYRQILAELMLERLRLGKKIPRAVICVSYNDNDGDNHSRNLSSDRVKQWLTKYPQSLQILEERHEVLGQLCLYTRPDNDADPAKSG